jgi:hypothetical protein
MVNAFFKPLLEKRERRAPQVPAVGSLSRPGSVEAMVATGLYEREPEESKSVLVNFRSIACGRRAFAPGRMSVPAGTLNSTHEREESGP